MAQELIYTSVGRGLRPGTRGYCTVAHTSGMAPGLVRLLESMSAYKNAFPHHGPQATLNLPAVSHHRATPGGQSIAILSRVGPSGSDPTHRDNTFAHHVVAGPQERPSAGPAWVAMQPNFFLDSWDGPARLIDDERDLPEGEVPVQPAKRWGELTGDPGWAAALVYALVARPHQPV